MEPSANRNTADKANGSEERLSINDRLALIGLIDEGVRLGSSDSPIVADLFDNLWNLVDGTVSGSKVDKLNAGETGNGFKVLEINGQTGENLGRLNMLYLKKPIPCYYLVYVEVASAFRKKGLGHRILDEFKKFLKSKSAVGILDNIIPREDPTYDIYLKHDWQTAENILGESWRTEDSVYMIYVPPSMSGKDLKTPVSRLLYHIKRKRSAIDMRDNEVMVARTIDEFKDLYSALLIYFEREIRNKEDHPLMRFMFTRFVTKLLGFSHRIRSLLGYTGGESLEQIVVDPEVLALPMQSYAPRNLASKPAFHAGDRELWLLLPEVLKKYPARIIESLPNYRRPSLMSWMQETGTSSSDTLTIGDAMDMGFDPTRLKEISINGEDFIFERVQVRLLPELEEHKELLDRISADMGGVRVKNTTLRTNPPLLVIRDRGNGYVLRRKVQGIHSEEAIEQLQSAASLKSLNDSLKVDRMIISTVRSTQDLLRSRMNLGDESIQGPLTYFVSWDLEVNRPKIVVDMTVSFLETVWVA